MSHVLEPSPQGVLRVVIFRHLVGRRTGPFTVHVISVRSTRFVLRLRVRTSQFLALGPVDQLLADLLEGLDVAGGQSDADLVDRGAIAEVLLGLSIGHGCGWAEGWR